MDISSIVNATLQLSRINQSVQTGSTSGVGTTTPDVSTLLAPATKRLSQQLESTKVQLSAFGQIKSAFSSVETSATSLAATAKKETATTADITKAAQAFVSAFNQATQTVNKTTSGGAEAGALATNVRARFAGNDLAQSATAATAASDLKSLGITSNKDGTLNLDVKALEQALQSNPSGTRDTIAALGGSVAATASREVGNSGNVGASVNSLTTRSQTLGTQQASLQKQAETLQASLDAQAATLNYTAATGLSAYKSLLG